MIFHEINVLIKQMQSKSRKPQQFHAAPFSELLQCMKSQYFCDPLKFFTKAQAFNGSVQQVYLLIGIHHVDVCLLSRNRAFNKNDIARDTTIRPRGLRKPNKQESCTRAKAQASSLFPLVYLLKFRSS